jgi:hypothetical protein
MAPAATLFALTAMFALPVDGIAPLGLLAVVFGLAARRALR